MTRNRRVEAETLAPVLTDLPPVIVLCAGMWTDKTKGGGWNITCTLFVCRISFFSYTLFQTECLITTGFKTDSGLCCCSWQTPNCSYDLSPHFSGSRVYVYLSAGTDQESEQEQFHFKSERHCTRERSQICFFPIQYSVVHCVILLIHDYITCLQCFFRLLSYFLRALLPRCIKRPSLCLLLHLFSSLADFLETTSKTD